MVNELLRYSGGIASLNRRLPSRNPSGCNAAVAVVVKNIKCVRQIPKAQSQTQTARPRTAIGGGTGIELSHRFVWSPAFGRSGRPSPKRRPPNPVQTDPTAPGFSVWNVPSPLDVRSPQQNL